MCGLVFCLFGFVVVVIPMLLSTEIKVIEVLFKSTGKLSR